jgi:hypothetical protein
MYVALHDGFSNPMRVPATRVVVYDDYDNPIGVFVQRQPGEIVCEIANKQDTRRLRQLLATLGINKCAIVDTINARDVGPG